ncbi:MAG: LysM peptidoglycan-binding domain-containing protein [Deltaproteobacteria bacterium]|nr:LysM peptidoglycan-binding domain-containing protein [Deltaproteobacteria bacterium]NIS77582.1 LysM peptidoglycan-binding domain-containing protein [Deltaproteobacteria bacterium]
MNRHIALLLILAVLSGSHSLALAAKESAGRPKIYLEKRVIAEKAGKQIKFFEVYRMEKGDSLWKIFTDKLGGRKSEFSLFVEAFEKANPGIANPSLIKRESRVKLPMNVGTLGKKNLLESMVRQGKIFEYTVTSGDILWRTAPGEFRSTREMLKYIEEVRELNPFLKNPDWIYPGQKFYLPNYSYFLEDGSEREPTFARMEEVAGEAQADLRDDEKEIAGSLDAAVVGDEKVRGESETEDLSPEKPVLDRPAEGDKGTLEVERAYPEKVFEKEMATKGDVDAGTITSTRPHGSQRPDFQMSLPKQRGLFSDLLSALGEKLILSGEMYVPLDGGGELVLNMEKYPIARFSNGRNVILDLWGSIPREVERVLRDKWMGYAVLRHDSEKGIDAFLENLLKAGGYYSVKDGRTTQLVIGDKVSVSINADLIALRENDSLLKGEVNAIKRLHLPSLSPIQSSIYAYCLKTGVLVIPYYVDRSIGEGYVVSYYAEATEDNYDREKVPEMLPDGAKYILDAAGVRSSRSHKISIKGKEGAFTLTIKPDLVFWAKKQPYILDPERFAEPITDLLVKEGYRIIHVEANSSYATIIPRLLKLAGVEYSLYENEIISGGKDKGYTLRASGFALKKESTGGERDILFVDGEVDLGLRGLLYRDFGMRVITY